MKFPLLLTIVTFIASCNQNTQSIDAAELKKEIVKAEHDFESVANTKGIAEGFYVYAAENASIRRGRDSIITGREGIRNFYSQPGFSKARLSWSPDFVDVSSDGTMGYTYGHYTWIESDSTGRNDTARGIFHTVWRKQQDGTWKYVWD